MSKQNLARLTLAAVAVLALAFTATLTFGQAGTSARLATFKIDPVHSSVIFRIRHNGVGNFYGRFNEVKGEFQIDPDSLAASSIRVEIPINSIDTANKGRDEHLKGTDFFSAAEHPTATFTSTSFEKSDSNNFVVKGKLTVRGQTHEVTAKVEWIGSRETGRQGYRSGMEAQFTFQRSKWGINYGIEAGALGDEVLMILAIQGVRQ